MFSRIELSSAATLLDVTALFESTNDILKEEQGTSFLDDLKQEIFSMEFLKRKMPTRQVFHVAIVQRVSALLLKLLELFSKLRVGHVHVSILENFRVSALHACFVA